METAQGQGFFYTNIGYHVRETPGVQVNTTFSKPNVIYKFFVFFSQQRCLLKMFIKLWLSLL